MVKSVFSLILHSPYIALDLSIPIAKKPTTPVRRSQIPSTSSGRLLEMHSNMVEEVVKLIKHKRFSCPGFILPVGTSSARWAIDSRRECRSHVGRGAACRGCWRSQGKVMNSGGRHNGEVISEVGKT